MGKQSESQVGDDANKTSGKDEHGDWNVLLSNVPRSHNFVCILMRRHMDNLSEKDRDTVYRVCELFQTSVMSVNIKTNYCGTFVKIAAINLEDPGSSHMLWSQIHTLIDHDSTAYLEIRNLNAENNVISTEKYILSDIELDFTRSYANANANKPQIITVAGEIRSELVCE